MINYSPKTIPDFETLSEEDQKILIAFKEKMKIKKTYLFQKEMSHGTSKGEKGNIYFIQAEDGSIKIGFANNVTRRLKELQRTCPSKLTVLISWEGNILEENLLHRKFQNSKNHHEWYHPTKEIMDFLLDRENNKPK